ncbi:maleylpyruvate isomerase [Mycobacterium sp. ACS1612]|uniref:DinB family protein n=1 Tax=Mycobacterium sp. ACS1612 TaxID=1834117 RepID=UPI0008010640|nr:DinB family protein [Mycobacterium sp. ACS1612]OBF29093.1 maleylpyruvate isomerase [Mycobacterium sp. ACS1612]
MSHSTADRAALAADLQRARTDFRHLLHAADEQDWNKSTQRTRWTNEQLLFHMVFGYMVVRRLIFLFRILGRLPDGASRRFAHVLDAAARPFHMINYYGTCAAALVYNRRRMGEKMDREITRLQRSLATENDDSFSRGMHYPTRWDPYFRDYMTLADIYRYPGQHYDHHRQQLTLTKM